MQDTADAFVEVFTIDGADDGPLSGLTFAAKDIYDVAGHVTGCGNPDWARTHGAATGHAPAVARLLGAGARLVGKSHTDELAYSLMGANAHYGTPRNSADPRRVPGGSSSGSVAAVAAGLADIGLGSDTGGSVRLPAAFCGVYGLRTSHGAVDIGGAMALAPSFDTVGWFARDPEILRRVCRAHDLAGDAAAPDRLLLPVDAWARAEPETVAALAPAMARLQAALGAAEPVVIAPEGLDTWREAFRIHQAAEVWEVHGAWVTETSPAFGPGVADRFRMAAAITAEEFAWSRDMRVRASDRVQGLLADGAVLVLPTGPGPAPLRETAQEALDGFRSRALELLCPAGLARLPQLSVPAGTVDGGPVGLGLVARRGGEGMLVSIAGAAA